MLVGLTGGIGSGKSTVAAALAGRGAAVVDADQIAREVVEPGGAAYAQLVERFGPGVLRADGTLDRQALADVAFNDPAALEDLNGITHPAIGAVVAERIGAAAQTHDIVVLDIPLLSITTKARIGFDFVVVVDAPEEVAVQRLVEQRGFKESDARARIAAQTSRDERRALADFVVDNSGDRSALDAEIERLWKWLREKKTGRTTQA
ncbi:MAG TPA: dephospho-CoA kinase [Acidimicrobiales bacterium]|nr:dephospho-CoA kinase [Acidimicrobiales bacterium]